MGYEALAPALQCEVQSTIATLPGRSISHLGRGGRARAGYRHDVATRLAETVFGRGPLAIFEKGSRLGPKLEATPV
jgi:hypothetical protein